MDKKQLLKLFKEFRKLQEDFCLIVLVPEIANWGGEYLLMQRLRKIDSKRTNEYLEILSAPVKLSFFQEEELELLSTAEIKDKEELKDVLEKHAKNFFWILNSYGGNMVLKSDYFSQRLKETIKEKPAIQKIKEIKDNIAYNKERKSQLARKVGLSKGIITIAKQLSQSIWWQDHRKAYIWRMNYWCDEILKLVSKKTDIKFEYLLWCWPSEIESLLEGRKFDIERIISRKKDYAVYFEGKNKEFKEYYGSEAHKLYSKYMNVGNIERKDKIKGMVVSKGKRSITKGKAAIIRNPFKDKGKMAQGEILIASMTSPEFVILMKKAAAIITDEGGMTCHAAVVSREIGIPCIVGTKVATKVLKDGDLVEVDAEKGVVKIIRK